MDVSRRTVLAAGGAGLGAAAVAVLGGAWFAGVLDDEPDVDGEVLLDEPGVYQQPIDGVNADVSGETVPDVVMFDTDGAEVRLSDHRGTPMILNLWFANCPPCRRELSDFAAVHAEVGDRVRFIGIDPFDTVDAMQRFAGERGVEYDLWRDPDRDFTAEIGVIAFPVTLFVDEAGRILRQTGEIDADDLRAGIDELF
ncbi:MAG: TlpA disulfide reductase family protein [Ilumatobacteraceae bacterium]|nr:TlpA disulfide reductase family protein [Ilumatobacteraceae bacterium]